MSSHTGDKAFISPFGFNDADKEEKILPQLYLRETGFNRQALDPLVSVIIGRRGSGKTALAQFLKFEKEDRYDVYVDVDEPDTYGQILLELSKRVDHNAALNVVDDVSKMWELAFWTSLMSEVLEINGIESSDDKKKVLKYLTAVNVRAGRGTQVIRTVFKVLAEFAAERAGAVVDLIFRVNDILKSVEFEEAKGAIYRYLEGGRKAVIVIDTLEQYDVRRTEMQQALGAMLHAVTQFALGKVHHNIQVKCFLPGEIVPYMLESTIQNIGKTFEFPVYLLWRPKDLLRLVCSRYYYFIKRDYPDIARSIPKVNWDSYADVRTKIWDRFFPEKISNRHGKQEDSFQYIIRHTQLRPRQIIWLCNSIAQVAYDRKVFPRFESQDVVRGVHGVEEFIASEILNSYSKVYPAMRQILNCFRGESNVLDRAAYLDKLAPRTRKAWPESMPYDRGTLWQMVSEIGFLGSVVEKTDRFYEAQFEYTTRDRLILNEDEECAIHPIFYKLFGIKAVKERPVYPVGPDRLEDA